MTFVLFLIFSIAIFGVMFLLSILKGVGSFIFGKSSSQTGYSAYNNKSNSHDGRNTDKSYQANNKKVFSKDEGEYVKYEEIKD